jgi:hypothetical protein
MTDWANSMAARLKARDQERQLAATNSAKTESVRTTRGEALWLEVKAQVKQNADALNTKTAQQSLTVEVVPGQEMQVRAVVDGAYRVLHVAYDRDSGTPGWKCDGQSGEWIVQVSSDGITNFVKATGMEAPSCPAKTATDMLTALLSF